MDDLDRAQDAFEEQLRLCNDHVVTHVASEALGGLAAIETRRRLRAQPGRGAGAALSSP
jgi:hypothetical protein